jgi:hypothetical protein
LGCTYAQYDNEWIFSAVGYELELDPDNDVPGTIKVLTSTPVKYSISSNQDITNHLNTITKPFLVSVL